MDSAPVYPLRGAKAAYNCKLVNPNGKLVDAWLQHSLMTQSARKRIRDGEEQDLTDDDMTAISDLESLVSDGHIHSQKRRLTTLDEASIRDAREVRHSLRENGRDHGSPMTDEDQDQAQQLPLPSPSASPIQAGRHSPALDPVELQLLTVPATQQELISMIVGLSSYLSPTNRHHLVFRLLQRTDRVMLSTFGDLINSSLKRDLLTTVPAEIGYNVLQHLLYRALLNVSRVSRSWHKMVDNAALWATLLKRDKLVKDDDEIARELADDESLAPWLGAGGHNSSCSKMQTLYKKRRIILNRWMDPKYEPRRISVAGLGKNVVTCLQHDEDKIIAGVEDLRINIYSAKTGELIRELEGHERPSGVWALKYFGNTLVLGSTDKTVRVWDLRTGRCTHVFRGHTSTVRCMHILHPQVIGKDEKGNDIVFPEHPLLVTGSRDHNLRVWRLPLVEDSCESDGTFDCGDAENPYLVMVLAGHTQSVRTVCGYGNLVVSGSYDTTVRVWDLRAGGRCKYVLLNHSDRIYSTALDVTTMQCFSGSMDSTINVWNLNDGKLIRTLQGHTMLVGLLELSDEYLVLAAADTTLRVWDPRTGENLSKLKGHTQAITCMHHDRLRVVSGSIEMLKLWNIQTGEFVRNLLPDISGGIWQVRLDQNRCVAAVQRKHNGLEEAFIEILDFSVPPDTSLADSVL